MWAVGVFPAAALAAAASFLPISPHERITVRLRNPGRSSRAQGSDLSPEARLRGCPAGSDI
jgi:hypothetical protein